MGSGSHSAVRHGTPAAALMTPPSSEHSPRPVAAELNVLERGRKSELKGRLPDPLQLSRHLPQAHLVSFCPRSTATHIHTENHSSQRLLKVGVAEAITHRCVIAPLDKMASRGAQKEDPRIKNLRIKTGILKRLQLSTKLLL